MDITLTDLIALEPTLSPVRVANTAGSAQLDVDRVPVSWAVTARTTIPHLPTLRGGEILLIPARVVAELGDEVAALVREAVMRQVSAVVLPESEAPDIESTANVNVVPMLTWRGELSIDAEMQINRHLTECRGELYRIGSELERQLADLTVNQAGVETFVQVASRAASLPLTVYDARGMMLASSASGDHGARNAEQAHGVYIREEFSGGQLHLGPLQAKQRIIARFLSQRLALAATAAMLRDDAARPRGARRAQATEALLTGRTAGAGDQRSAALALGLDPDAVYMVAISRGGAEAAIARALAPLGDVHAAGESNGQRTWLIAASSRGGVIGLRERVSTVERHWESAQPDGGATLAFSAPAFGVASLPTATREAAFVHALQAKSSFQKRAASFASVDDVGALRLLYLLRDSLELRSFVNDALGALESRDRRGTLRETLRAFLESGGSQVDASQRLGIHRNTLAYRLRRIGELVGRDVADPASWLTLHLALRASEVLAAYAGEG